MGHQSFGRNVGPSREHQCCRLGKFSELICIEESVWDINHFVAKLAQVVNTTAVTWKKSRNENVLRS